MLPLLLFHRFPWIWNHFWFHLSCLLCFLSLHETCLTCYNTVITERLRMPRRPIHLHSWQASPQFTGHHNRFTHKPDTGSLTSLFLAKYKITKCKVHFLVTVTHYCSFSLVQSLQTIASTAAGSSKMHNYAHCCSATTTTFGVWFLNFYVNNSMRIKTTCSDEQRYTWNSWLPDMFMSSS